MLYVHARLLCTYVCVCLRACVVCVHIYTCTNGRLLLGKWPCTCVCVLCTCVVCIHIHMYGRLYTLREGTMNSYGRMWWGHDLNVMLLEVSQRRGISLKTQEMPPFFHPLKGTIRVCRYSRCTFYVQQGDKNVIPKSNIYTM